MNAARLFCWIHVTLVACLSVNRTEAERARQADEFVDTIGMNTRMTDAASAYGKDWPRVLKALQSLRVRHIRDSFYGWEPMPGFYARHQQLKDAGIDCDYVVRYTPTETQVTVLQQQAGDVGALEAPDEADGRSEEGDASRTWVSVLQELMPALHGLGQVAGVPVIGPSLTYKDSYRLLGDVSSQMSFNGVHMYFDGRNPGSTGRDDRPAGERAYGSLPWWIDEAQADAPGVRVYVTETGYLATPVVTPYTLPYEIEAKYAVRTMLEMFRAGIAREYFYELVDDREEPGYGFFDESLKPKLVATATASLLGLLEDRGAGFQPGVLNFTLERASPLVHHVLLQKRNHDFYLVLWIEASGYDEAANVTTPVPAQKVELALTGAVTERVYEMSDQGKWASVVESEASLPLTLTDRLTIVKIASE